MPSSVISSFDYNSQDLQLKITFVSGMAYTYFDVPAGIYEEMRVSKSKGIFFNKRIKGKFNFKRAD